MTLSNLQGLCGSSFFDTKPDFQNKKKRKEPFKERLDRNSLKETPGTLNPKPQVVSPEP